MLLSPTQRAVLRALGEDGISGTIATPAARAYTIFLAAPFACVITGLQAVTSAGTLTANVKIGAVSVTGLSAVAVTNVASDTTATGANQVQEGNLITITLSAIVGAADFSYVLNYTRPG